MEVLT
ncbi:hypothetical protein BsWGS_10057 [Bradybaena similaris]